jgi:hypothetical protein
MIQIVKIINRFKRNIIIYNNFYLLEQMNTAILALIGVISAADLKHHRRTYQTAKLMDNGFISLGQ